jgi:hypothetical protein
MSIRNGQVDQMGSGILRRHNLPTIEARASAKSEEALRESRGRYFLGLPELAARLGDAG